MGFCAFSFHIMERIGEHDVSMQEIPFLHETPEMQKEDVLLMDTYISQYFSVENRDALFNDEDDFIINTPSI